MGVRGGPETEVSRETDPDALVQAVLDSRTFRRAPALRALLTYLWERRNGALTEYAIAVDALGRRPDFDPKADATVRVHVARLRHKLKEYYESERPYALNRLVLPAGSYHLEISSGVRPERGKSRHHLWRWTAAALATLCCALLALDVQLRTRLNERPSPQPLPPLWRNFFSNGFRTWLVIPTPVFLHWEGRKLRVRDVAINEFSDYAKSPELASLVRRFGPPALHQNYAVAADALGALNLVQYLAAHGRQVHAGSTGDIAVESFLDHNIIFFGIPATSTHLKALLDNTNFTLGSTANQILNRNPQAGEPAVFRGTTYSPKRSVLNGIISMLPGKSRGASLLILAGPRTSALVSAITSPAGLESLHNAWRAHGSPRHFEMVVQAELDDNRVLQVKPLAMRAVTGDPGPGYR